MGNKTGGIDASGVIIGVVMMIVVFIVTFLLVGNSAGSITTAEKGF